MTFFVNRAMGVNPNLMYSIKIGTTQQIGAGVCSGYFCVHDVLIWKHFEFTMCSITVLTQNKHTLTQCEHKWYTYKAQPDTWKTHYVLNINTKVNFVLKHNISSTSKIQWCFNANMLGMTRSRSQCFYSAAPLIWSVRYKMLIIHALKLSVRDEILQVLLS